jgi:hypothetical protein
MPLAGKGERTMKRYEDEPLPKDLKIIIAVVAVIVLFALLAFSRSSHAAQSSADSLVMWMARCDTLPKIVLSWPIAPAVPKTYVYEYARLTGRISLNLSGVYTQDEIDAFVQLADSLNNHVVVANKKVSLAWNYSPYPAATFTERDPTSQQAESVTELANLDTKLAAKKLMVSIANAKFITGAADSILNTDIIFDQETFNGAPTGQAWLDSLTSKMNACYSRAQTAFPNCKVHWYDRGGWHVTGGDPDGWTDNTYFSLVENGTNFSCVLYRPWELQDMRDTFRYSLENAWRHGVSNITCYLSLGSGYVRYVEGTAPTAAQAWDNDVDYGRWYAWQLGREINNAWYGAAVRWLRYAPWDYCDYIIFYNASGPFTDTCPHFGEYFCAYMWGANDTQTVFPAVVP